MNRSFNQNIIYISVYQQKIQQPKREG